jgi:RNA polymerase sigma-70 factor (ECF subfamily)
MENGDFRRFVTAVRSGDQGAAEELVRRYEPYIRRVVRLRLHDSRLARLFDSMDICQSIMASFFRHAADGDFDLATAGDLGSLLVRMALNKLATKARGLAREEGSLPPGWDAIDPHPSPAEQAERQESFDAIRRRLSEDELRLFELNKVQGRSWPDIARETGDRPDALRVRLARALARVRREVQKEAACHVPRDPPAQPTNG